MLRAACILAIALSASTAAAADGTAEIDPAGMSRDQIRAHNAKVPRDDPSYIRCVRFAGPGSLIENKLRCLTNAQWKQSNRAAEQNARDTAEAMRGRLEGPPETVCKDPATC
jgi:hypothetical protein